MSSLRTLLLALMLPALLLPDGGMTLCLRRLVGEPAAPERESCCRRCCQRAEAERASATLREDDGCMHCCVAVPATGRSVEPAPRKIHDALAPALVLAPPPQDSMIPSFASIARPRAEHDPGLARATAPPISLPLRL